MKKEYKKFLDEMRKTWPFKELHLPRPERKEEPEKPKKE